MMVTLLLGVKVRKPEEIKVRVLGKGLQTTSSSCHLCNGSFLCPSLPEFPATVMRKAVPSLNIFQPTLSHQGFHSTGDKKF
jgi:hypothetical protein